MTPTFPILTRIYIKRVHIENSVVIFERYRDSVDILKSYVAIVAAVGLCVSFSTAYAESTIAIAYTRHEIVVAADSKGVYGQGGQSQVGEPPPICKIRQAGDFFWASTGLLSGYGFDLPTIVNGISTKTNESLPARMADLNTAIHDPLINKLGQIRQTEPGRYRGFLTKRIFPIEISFWRMEANTPAIVGERFVVSENAAGTIFIQPDAVDLPKPAPLGLFPLGARNAIYEYSAAGKFAKMTPLAIARKAVELEIEAYPSEVGPPIIILIVDSKGARWADPKPQHCPQIKNTPKTHR